MRSPLPDEFQALKQALADLGDDMPFLNVREARRHFKAMRDLERRVERIEADIETLFATVRTNANHESDEPLLSYNPTVKE